MKIKLIACKNMDGMETARIFIFAEENETGFIINSAEKRNLMFHHNPCVHSLREYCPRFKDRDENYFIEFQVDKPFNTFCSALRKSHFNNRKNFSKITHNCSHAANYALELAGIKLHLKPFYFPNRVSSFSYFFVPGFILTPYELFLAAKNYKIKLLTNQKINEIFHAKTQTLQETTLKTQDSVIQDVNTIISEINTRFRENPHHAEFYIKVLMQTNDLLIQLMHHQKITDTQKEMYRESAHFFQNPLPKKTSTTFDYRNLLLLFAVFGFLKYMKSHHQTSIIKTCLMFGASLALIANRFKPNTVVTQVETRLSKAILNLSDWVQENESEATMQIKPFF